MATTHISYVYLINVKKTTTSSTIQSADHSFYEYTTMGDCWYVPGTQVERYELSTAKKQKYRELGTPGTRDLVSPTILTT